jgi:AraC-like DNA-binding protein
MHQDSRLAVIESGNFALWDTMRPCGLSLPTRTKCVTVTIPRRALEARLGTVAQLAVQPMVRRDPLAGLASGFIAMLAERSGEFAGAAASRIAEHALDLVALAFSVEGQKGVALSSPRAIALMRLKAAIEARLGDPELKPAVAAAAAGISIRYANELLAPEGSSVERYILDRRLERCRRTLEEPGLAHRTIGDIAFGWGFLDLSHFGRRFKAAFGCSPSEYRREALEKSRLTGRTPSRPSAKSD